MGLGMQVYDHASGLNVGGSWDGHIPGRSRLALWGLVDMRRRVGRAHIATLEAVQGNVVADDVVDGVDAVVEVAHGTREAAGRDADIADDLVGCGNDVVGGCEGKDILPVLSLPALVAPSRDCGGRQG